MDNDPSPDPNPSIFFFPNVKTILEEQDIPKDKPTGDIWGLLYRSITAQWIRKTGKTRGELLQEAMDSPAVPYEPVWETTDLFCPNCGAKGLLVEEGDSDYYQGPKHRCESCKETRYIQ